MRSERARGQRQRAGCREESRMWESGRREGERESGGREEGKEKRKGERRVGGGPVKNTYKSHVLAQHPPIRFVGNCHSVVGVCIPIGQQEVGEDQASLPVHSTAPEKQIRLSFTALHPS